MPVPANRSNAAQPPALRPWPEGMRHRVTAVRAYVFEHMKQPKTAGEIAAAFEGARTAEVESILESLVLLGVVWQREDGRVVV